MLISALAGTAKNGHTHGAHVTGLAQSALVCPGTGSEVFCVEAGRLQVRWNWFPSPVL